jgi:hypothetical protein
MDAIRFSTSLLIVMRIQLSVTRRSARYFDDSLSAEDRKYHKPSAYQSNSSDDSSSEIASRSPSWVPWQDEPVHCTLVTTSVDTAGCVDPFALCDH